MIWKRFCLFTVGVALSSAGCCPTKPLETNASWRGPTDPMAQVVAAINRDNHAISSLWARHYFVGNVIDDRGKTHFINAEGILLMSKPASVRLVAKKEFGTIFDLGTDGQRFWMSVPVEVDTMWWGYNRNIGKPCSRAIPIQPEGILEVLGVGEFDADLKHAPVPVMRFDAERDAYVFLWSRPLTDRWVATKEVWYDRTTKRPVRVQLYDLDGRVALRAELSDFKQVELPGEAAKAGWPWMATTYRLFFPDSGSKITISLSDMHLRSEEGGVPNARSFVMPNPEQAQVAKVVQIDEECGQ